MNGGAPPYHRGLAANKPCTYLRRTTYPGQGTSPPPCGCRRPSLPDCVLDRPALTLAITPPPPGGASEPGGRTALPRAGRHIFRDSVNVAKTRFVAPIFPGSIWSLAATTLLIRSPFGSIRVNGAQSRHARAAARAAPCAGSRQCGTSGRARRRCSYHRRGSSPTGPSPGTQRTAAVSRASPWRTVSPA